MLDLALIALLILINALFAMSEMALSAARRVRLQALADEGDGAAQTALTLMDKPTQFLSTVQVGITSIGVLNGIVGEAAFSQSVAGWLQGAGLAAGASQLAATASVVAVITFVTIIFGELVPKRVAQLHPERVARATAPLMQFLARLARPFVALLSLTTGGVLRLLRVNTSGSQSITEEEIAAQLSQGLDAGVIDEGEHELIRNVFALDERRLSSFMLPRAHIETLGAEQTVQQALQSYQAQPHSWYPVCGERGLDHVLGLVSAAQLSAAQLSAAAFASHSNGMPHSKAEPTLKALFEATWQQPAFVPESLSALDLLEQFREKSRRMVLVVDEYGSVQGMVTARDLLEAITGELHSSAAESAWMQHISATPQATAHETPHWLVSGATPVAEFKSRLEIEDELSGEAEQRYSTVAGLLQHLGGKLPVQGEFFAVGGWRLTVAHTQGWRVVTVRADKLEGGAA